MSALVIGLLVAFVMIAVIWFAFVAPSERRYHERKLKLMQERIEKRERHIKDSEAAPESGAADADG